MAPKRKAESDIAVRRTVRPRANYNAVPPRRIPRSLASRMSVYGIPPEVKYQSGSVNLALNTTGGVEELMHYLVQGDTNSSRDGHQIFVRDLEMHIATYPAQTDSSPCICRFAVVVDSQTSNGAAPAWTDVFDQNDPRGMIRWDRRGRYQVLKNWEWSESNQISLGGAGSTPCFRSRVMKIPINKYVQYSANASAVTDIVSNSISLMTKGSQSLGYGFTCSIFWRFTFMG